ncbi:MAG: DUF1922 domain-containing protein [Candidatus Bathyarchaeota archaeon]|nr:MAG: DUF1922 domain-containing protein [Candidatus Bathyarchaeota archaeon]
MYAVIVCFRCGQLLLAKTYQKTRRCPYCETRLILSKTRKVATAETAREASTLIRTLKQKKRMEPPDFKR